MGRTKQRPSLETQRAVCGLICEGMIYRGSVVVHLGEITSKEIRTNKKFAKHFKDVNNPTTAEIEKYFDKQLQYLAESNSGSEALANSPVDVEVEEEDDKKSDDEFSGFQDERTKGPLEI